MNEQTVHYLPGAVPYPQEEIDRYVANNWWINRTFVDFLNDACARYPDKLAVTDGCERWTWRELRQKVYKFGLSLRQLGIRKYDRILLQLPNYCEFLVAYLGSQVAGAVPVLTVPRHDALQIGDTLKMTEAAAWIISARDGERSQLPLINAVRKEHGSLRHLIMLGDPGQFPEGALDMRSLIEEASGIAAFPEVDPNDVAHIVLTGGTTGKSKAVPRTYNSIIACSRYTTSGFASLDDVNLLATPAGHSMAIQGPIGSTLMNASTLVMIQVLRPKEIAEAIRKERVTRASLVPTQLIGLLNMPDLDHYDLSSLKFVRVAGAALDPEIARKAGEFFRKIGCVFVPSSYGSSEGPAAGFRPEELEDPESIPLASVGRPFVPGDEWIAIDDRENVLPPGQIGELAVKGPGVFTGYYNSKQENDRVFTRTGYYKTGDLGRIDPEGYIYITGRKKDIIQRGAEGIVPGEIEDLLIRHPKIASVAVVAMPDPRLGEKACACVVLKEGETFSFEEMIEFLKGEGAGVLMWPERLEIRDSLPLTPIGKIDKQTLRREIADIVQRELSSGEGGNNP